MSDKSAEDLKDYNRKQLAEYMQLLLFEKAGIKYKGASQETKQKMKSLKKLFDKKLEEDVEKYRDYQFNRDRYITGKSQKQIIDSILGIQKLQRLDGGLGEEKEEIEPSGRKKKGEQESKIIENFDDAQANFERVYEKNKGKETTSEIVAEFMEAYDKLKDVDKAAIEQTQQSATEDSSKIVAEATLIVKDKIKKLSKKNIKPEEQQLIKGVRDELEKESKDYNKIRINTAESEIASEKELQRIYQNLGMMAVSAIDRKRQQREMSKMLGAEEGKEEMEQKEEPYTPKPVVGTDYRGSKEMFEPSKQEQKPLEPFGGLPSQNEVEAPYLSTKSDKAIGDVRQVGFIGAQDQLAKVEDVTLEPSERSKSLKRFTNFRWVQSVQNSDLGYASPFQRMDDIDDRRRFGKCFMHANKMPKDADTQDELDKAKAFNTYSLVPSFDMSSRMQPATPLSFINSTSKFARKLTADEMEPINQGKRNVNNDKNKLEFTTVLHSDDPLKRIKDKYKNNIIC
jgi:hypothetical protein